MKLQSLMLFSLLFAASSCLEVPDNGDREKQDRQTPGADGGGVTTDISKALRSHAFRYKGTAQQTIDGIREYVATNNAYPSNFSAVPDRQVHDSDRESTRYARRNKNCGTNDLIGADPSITKRMANCKTVYKDDVNAYLWNGKLNGISGEGNWQLVVKKGDRHVWIDLSTNLVWTELVTEANWTNASGSQANEADSICSQTFLENDANDTNTDLFMGLTADEINLRLPTRNDFLQADLNGARFVLGNLENKVYWSANYSYDDNMAWAIDFSTGVLAKVINTANLSVRCIGVITK